MSKRWQTWAVAGAAVGMAGAILWQRRQQQAATTDTTPFGTKYGPWAIVTGAARAEGIGYGFARHLAGRQINLVLVDILADELEARAAELRRNYLVKVRPVALDLGQPDFIDRLLAETDGLDIGLLICNHMYTPSDTPPILDMPLAMHHRMLDINARAYTTLAHTYGRQMVNKGRGGIILVSSGAGMRGTAYTGAYSANKAYQLMFGEALWYELLGSGVDVLVLAPGLTRTQGDALDNYPAFMLMDVEPVVKETLAGLGKQHLVIPGPVNKMFEVLSSRIMSRRQAVMTTGQLMAQGLQKE
jgi:hypothetical protein